jgi:catechol 2,3-dioxygenase-like lactoylglutathione lyase family enzyme
MFDHVGLRVKDLAASVRLYRAMLEPLGYVLCSEDEGGAGFGPAGSPSLWLVADPKGGGAHVALTARDRSAVAAFHGAAVVAGARDRGAPGLRDDYGPRYYAAFVLDLDGNNVEAVSHG